MYFKRIDLHLTVALREKKKKVLNQGWTVIIKYPSWNVSSKTVSYVIIESKMLRIIACVTIYWMHAHLKGPHCCQCT